MWRSSSLFSVLFWVFLLTGLLRFYTYFSSVQVFAAIVLSLCPSALVGFLDLPHLYRLFCSFFADPSFLARESESKREGVRRKRDSESNRLLLNCIKLLGNWLKIERKRIFSIAHSRLEELETAIEEQEGGIFSILIQD